VNYRTLEELYSFQEGISLNINTFYAFQFISLKTMASSSYEIGGIFNVLQKTVAVDNTPTSSDEEEPKDTELANLFSFKPPEIIEDKDEENDIPDELIKEYISAEDKKPVEPKLKKKKLDDEKEATKKFDEESPERKARTVFVGNVALTVKKKVLKKIFSKFGEIESIRIRSVPRADPKTSKKVAFIKKEFHDERDNMNAYVVFKNKEDAVKSLKSNGIIVEEKHIRVDLSENKKHNTSASIFVGNLPFNAKEDAIREHFAKCGNIEDIRVVRDKATGIGKGFAYIRFKGKENVMFGLKMNGSEFDGRKLRVFKAKDKEEVNTTNTTRKFKGKTVHNKKNFQGLRSTSQKDIKMGKKLFASKGKPTERSNALRRIKSKNQKSRQQKQSKAQKKNEKLKKK